MDKAPRIHTGSLRKLISGSGVCRATLALLLGAVVGVGHAAAANAAGDVAITYGGQAVVPHEFKGDVRNLPQAMPSQAPTRRVTLPVMRPPFAGKVAAPAPKILEVPPKGVQAPMPSPIRNFAGMSSNDACTGGSCGSGWPPDNNGDVGLAHYIQAVNSSYAIYNKTGTLLASFTENQLWLGAGSTPCTGHGQGDPIVVYDQLADRWILTHFAFNTSGGGDPISPYYQCIAASKTNDPVAGGWWLYPVRMDPGGAGLPPVGALNDYGKFGLWHDCLYMGANEFDFTDPNNPSYIGVAFGSFSRADLYNGKPLTYALGYLPYPANVIFSMFPSNNLGRGIYGVQPGTPNYYVSESQTLYEFEVRKFTPGPNCGAGGTMGAINHVSQTNYAFQFGAFVPQPNTSNKLDMIDDRMMQKIQYRKIGSAESVWVTHNVGTGTDATPGPTIAMQWAQINVTGGTVASSPVQQGIHAPDQTLNRFMGALAVDRQGNMALGYTTSNGSVPNFPSISYAGRLVGDTLGTLPQTETQLVAGLGSQTNSCGGPCDRWGDYSAMSIDPADDCTFWYTNQYYSSQTNGTSGNWQTRIGSFKFPGCTGLVLTSTAILSFPNPSTSGSLVTFTATVSGTSPTGTIAFTADGLTIAGCGAVVMVSGSAPCSTSILTVGSHNIVANYSGDSTNTPSVSPITVQVVNPPLAHKDRDYNGDFKGDLLWQSSTTQTAIWLMNGLTYSSYATINVDPLWTVTHTGDISGDGKTDLVWRNASNGQTATWVMNGLVASSASIVLSDANWVVTNTGDLNGDGKVDLIWRNTVTGQTNGWLMNGVTYSSYGTIFTDVNWAVTHTGDFNGDGKADLVWRNSATGQTAIWLMNGLTYASYAIILSDANWVVSKVGDFNGDGKADLLWRNNATGATAIWLMNGLTASSSATILADPAWVVTHTGDFNGDGKTDLLWYKSATGQTSIWLMNGLTATTATVILQDPSWSVNYTSDTNGDGKTDLMWRHSGSGQSLAWLMNGVTYTSYGTLLSDPNWVVKNPLGQP